MRGDETAIAHRRKVLFPRRQACGDKLPVDARRLEPAAHVVVNDAELIAVVNLDFLIQRHRLGLPLFQEEDLGAIRIVAHEGGDFLSQRFGFPLRVLAIHRAGFNAATLVAPYHFQRRVRCIEAFDRRRVAEAFAQAVVEVRALTGWLVDQDSPVALLAFHSAEGLPAWRRHATADSRQLFSRCPACARIIWQPAVKGFFGRRCAKHWKNKKAARSPGQNADEFR
jgi:hypothetical protein